jgi:hypothetical protein
VEVDRATAKNRTTMHLMHDPLVRQHAIYNMIDVMIIQPFRLT